MAHWRQSAALDSVQGRPSATDDADRSTQDGVQRSYWILAVGSKTKRVDRRDIRLDKAPRPRQVGTGPGSLRPALVRQTIGQRRMRTWISSTRTVAVAW
jgi:hypothetical protein